MPSIASTSCAGTRTASANCCTPATVGAGSSTVRRRERARSAPLRRLPRALGASPVGGAGRAADPRRASGARARAPALGAPRRLGQARRPHLARLRRQQGAHPGGALRRGAGAGREPRVLDGGLWLQPRGSDGPARAAGRAPPRGGALSPADEPHRRGQPARDPVERRRGRRPAPLVGAAAGHGARAPAPRPPRGGGLRDGPRGRHPRGGPSATSRRPSSWPTRSPRERSLRRASSSSGSAPPARRRASWSA